MVNKDRAAEIVRRHGEAVLIRGPWESQWDEIARKLLPAHAGTFSLSNTSKTSGVPRTDEMVDATASLALVRFAAAMESMLTPRNSMWHRLVPSDKKLLKNRSVRLYFDEITELLFKYRYAPQANFASQKHQDYMSLGAFGTGCIYTDPLDGYGGGLRYKAIHLGEIYFLENHQGIIDSAYRKFPMKPRQAIQAFGENCPEKIRAAAKDGKNSQMDYWFIHAVYPREESMDGYDPTRKDVKGMRFASCYVAVEDPEIVKELGFHNFPYSISRYTLAPGDIYGWSPAMMALPAIKTLNEEKRTVLKQGHRVVEPVLLAHDDGILDTFSLRPGAVNPGGVSAEGRPLVHALPVGNLSLAKEMMDAEKLTINDFFLVTLFQILVDTPSMTATEVLERAREKGALLSPTMGRQQSEALGTMIPREIDVLGLQNILPPMPDLLKEAKGEFAIEYDSPLSRAQRAEEAAGLFRTIDWVREYVAVTQDATPLDWVEWDTAMPDILDIQAVPARWQRSLEKVMEVRAERQKDAEMQQAIDAAPAAASVAKTIGVGAGAPAGV
jgi:hypothetical protein